MTLDQFDCRIHVWFFFFIQIIIYNRYLLATSWFKQWKKFVGYESWDAFNAGQQEANPGHIDNLPILEGLLTVY